MPSLLNLFYEVSPYEGFDPKEQPDDLQGWASTRPIFEEVMRVIRPDVIIEVGTWKGASAIHLAKLAAKLEFETQVICVDTWLGSAECFLGYHPSWRESLRLEHAYPRLYFTFLANVLRHGCEGAIIPIANTSENGALILRRKRIDADLIYIDAAHHYEAVLADLRAYWPLLKTRGVLLGDDYTNDNGVVRAAQEFAKEVHVPITEVDGKFLISKDPQIVRRIVPS